jgi:hypothetical protein
VSDASGVSAGPGRTVQLRLRGIMPMQVAAATVAAAPLIFLSYQSLVRHSRLVLHSPLLVGLCAAAALLPWLSRALARASYRAKCDDIAVHVRAEALPYKTIKELRLERTPRRVTLHLVRSADIELVLVLRDVYAGRLEPLDVLRERLAKHGLRLEPI